MSPPSVTVSGVSNPYDIGQPVAVDCTVIAVVPDPHNMARIRWAGVNNYSIKSINVYPTTIYGIHYINYTYPLTINSISLSDAGQYSCTARIHSNGVLNLQDSYTVVQSVSITINCESLVLK